MNNEGVLLCQAVAYLHKKFSRIALLPRLRGAGKDHHIIKILGAPLPQAAVKAPFAAVQVVFAVIRAKGIGFPIELEASPSDAVCHPPYCPAEVRCCHIVGNGIAPQCNILYPSCLIRHANTVHCRAVVQQVHLHGVVIKQGKACYRLSIRRPPEKVFVNHTASFSFNE